MKTFHFDMGDSTAGGLGCTAVIDAEDIAEASQKLREALPECDDLWQRVKGVRGVTIYFNADHLLQNARVTETGPDGVP